MIVTIIGTVRNDQKESIEIKIFTDELENLILEKAKSLGIKGYQGRVFEHYDEQIISVSVKE